MFDKPKEELKKLETQLLAADEPRRDNFEALYRDILKEYGPDTEGNPSRSSAPESTPGSAKAGTGKKTKKRTKLDRQIRGLVIALIVECTGILGVLLWWMFRFL